ncbi:StbA family protein (plasmid) [Vibrio breoganii]|uniref:StbA family protein n=2 Tax=Vibrio TaxID=662 RepID=A0AAN1CUN3_9VIBR|nr:plasmid segregation protein ParM domain-containing protein [Vibrio breoganii]ANO35647.1 StbA family protein [Vibrio breoganii]PML12814.1 StbA family protein [Vibrio breoganii]
MQMIAVDDGSTQCKLSYLLGKEIKSKVVPNSLKKGWQSAALRGTPSSNWMLDGKRYSYDITSDSSLDTQHIDYQLSDENLLSVHNALQQTELDPTAPTVLICTLPITQYYNQDDMQKNEDLIEAKKSNLLRSVELNGGTPFNIVEVRVMPESAPACLSTLLESQAADFNRTLCIDVGGTTSDLSVIRGAFLEITAVMGLPKVGVSWVTTAAKTALSAADSDVSYYVCNELIKNRHNMEFVKEVINDHSKIDEILARIDQRIAELGETVANECKRFCKNPNRVILVGGGSNLIADAITEAYSTLGERVILLENAQCALSQEILRFHLDEDATAESKVA